MRTFLIILFLMLGGCSEGPHCIEKRQALIFMPHPGNTTIIVPMIVEQCVKRGEQPAAITSNQQEH